MKKKLISPAIIALTIASSFAQASSMTGQKIAGFYLGGAAGTSKSYISNTETTSSSGHTSTYTGSFSEQDKAFKVITGYQFNRIIAIEAAYADLGTFNGDFNEKVKVNVRSLSTNLGYTFPSGVRPFALFGLGRVSQFEDKSDTEMSVHYGIGIEFAPPISHGVTFRAAYEADFFTIPSTDTDKNGTEKNDMHFTYSTLTVGASYKF